MSTKMDKEMKAKWLKALRSGEYSQRRRRLVDQYDNFCCLGVLCNISDDSLGEWGYKKSTKEWGFLSIEGKEDFYESMPPDSVLSKAGVPCNIASLLAEKNDLGESFEQIAEFIEERL